MVTKDFTGYKEGVDLTKLPPNALAYPSKNCIVHKGVVQSRLGIALKGSAGSTDKEVHSEKVWKDSKSGEMPLRVTDTILQVYLESYKDGAGWVELLTGLDSDIERLEFATFTDINTTIIKKRMFMVDGSEKMYQWNGGVGVVASWVGDTITISGDLNLNQLGFDDGSVTTQTILLNGTAYTYSHDPTTKILTLDSTPTTPAVGDLIIVQPLTHSATLSAIDKDHIYSYKNHIIIGNLTSNDLYFSHTTTYSMATGLDYTVPVAGSRTAVSPMYFTLDANITAMRERKNVLWVSTIDDWFKITKLYSKNGFDEWATVEKVENALRMGALPFAVAGHKGDMIFVAQDSTVQTVSDIEILEADQIKLISDDVEDMLLRYDLTGCRIYYTGRYIYITVKAESVLIMLDVVEGHWQPPQTIPISCFSIIDGDKVGHSNNNDESFDLFSGTNDFDADIETVMAFGYQSYSKNINEFDYFWFEKFGVSGRMTGNTVCKANVYYETDGAKSSNEITIDGSVIKTYDIATDDSWGKNPFGSASWAGGDVDVSDLKRFFVFDRFKPVSFFEWRPIFTISGENQNFHLLAFGADISKSDNSIGKDLFISK